METAQRLLHSQFSGGGAPGSSTHCPLSRQPGALPAGELTYTPVAVVTDGTTYDAPPALGLPLEPCAYVAIVAGQEPQVVDLPLGREVSLGRSSSSGVRIDDLAASRLQATIRWDGGPSATLIDHDSRNGTQVDGRKVIGSAPLVSGSEIVVGATHMVVAIRIPPAQGSDAGVDEALLLALDPVMLKTVALAEWAANGDSTVLLVGETGAGKEVLARRIHAHGKRAAGPFIAVNCGSIPETLAESTLFGHEKGSFTGASDRRTGLFEAAGGGTLFLDEVGELSVSTQARLLRVLEEHALTRIGATEPISVDVRVIAATNRDVEAMSRDGGFRRDLLYRLDVIRIEVPPLRDRPSDIAPLAQRFVRQLAGDAPVILTADAIKALEAHAWPGNVRQLRNVIERSIAVRERDALTEENLIGLDDGLPTSGGGALRHRVDDVERDTIAEALEVCRGNQTKTAKRLGISRRTLIYKMERYGLKPPPRSK